MRTRRRMLAAGLAVMALGAATVEVEATRFTETAKFYVGSQTPSSPPPLQALEIQGLSGGGGLFTNTTGLIAMGGGTVTINTVGANIIRGADLNPLSSTSGVISPVDLGTPGTDLVMVVFALQGVATPTSPSSATALFNAGEAWVISFDDLGLAAGFEANNPTSWQFNPAQANVLAKYVLAPQEGVAQGLNGDTIGNPPVTGVSASDTNVSAINLLNDTLSQGILLFDFEQNGPALPSPDFQVNVPPGTLAGQPLPFPLTGKPDTEGLVVISSQQNPNTAPGFDAADEAVLNSIFTTMLGTTFSSPGPFTSFQIGTPGVGDFFNEFNFDANPTSQANIPEPAMLGMLGLGGLALISRRRKLA